MRSICILPSFRKNHQQLRDSETRNTLNRDRTFNRVCLKLQQFVRYRSGCAKKPLGINDSCVNDFSSRIFFSKCSWNIRTCVTRTPVMVFNEYSETRAFRSLECSSSPTPPIRKLSTSWVACFPPYGCTMDVGRRQSPFGCEPPVSMGERTTGVVYLLGLGPCEPVPSSPDRTRCSRRFRKRSTDHRSRGYRQWEMY